ncbi:MAG TPA: apolipoprotein N-acyltransferase, partial [Rugosimonospora sp.]|nr:apolipoprotein N-acyltransferase [Rugosimonospora sp.]
TFNSAEAQQQLAMVRLRAVEHGRAALMASTVGVSAFVDAHGTVSQATGFNTPSVVVAHLRLGGARTLATETGPAPEYGLVGLAAIALLAAGLLRWRRRPAAEPPVAEEIQEDQ